MSLHPASEVLRAADFDIRNDALVKAAESVFGEFSDAVQGELELLSRALLGALGERPISDKSVNALMLAVSSLAVDHLMHPEEFHA